MRRWFALAFLAGCRFGFADEPVGGPDGSVDGSDAVAHDLTITVVGRGAIVGPSGLCTTQCTFSVVGDETFTAYPADTWSLEPSSVCSGTGCTVPSGDTAVTFTFVQQPITANVAFVSSTGGPTTSGIGALDAHCQTLATAAGLAGTFIAFASTTTTNARDRFAGSRGWVRVDGIPVLDQITDVGSPTLPHALTLDEKGARQPQTGGVIATGSNADGTVSTGNNCGDWTTTTMQISGGFPFGAADWMLGGWSAGCGSTNRFVCMQKGRSVAVPVTPSKFPLGRRIFATKANLAIGAIGVAAGDQLCQSEAAAAGLTGTYRALLATTTQSVADHLGSLAGPWRRTDDVLVTLGALDTPDYDVALTVDAAGANHTPMIAFGAPDFHSLALPADSCQDWTNPTLTLRTLSSKLESLLSVIASGGFGGNCGQASVLCAELP